MREDILTMGKLFRFSYPAGFIYIYLIFYYITNFGRNIRLAQYVFAGLYLIMISAVFYLYQRNAKVSLFIDSSNRINVFFLV